MSPSFFPKNAKVSLTGGGKQVLLCFHPGCFCSRTPGQVQRGFQALGFHPPPLMGCRRAPCAPPTSPISHQSPLEMEERGVLGGGCAQQGLQRSGEFPVGTARCRSPSLPLLLLLLFLLSASPPPSLPPSPPPFPSSPLTTSSLSLRLFSLHLPSPLLTLFLLISSPSLSMLLPTDPPSSHPLRSMPRFPHLLSSISRSHPTPPAQMKSLGTTPGRRRPPHGDPLQPRGCLQCVGQ